jgi:hypothetical protein
LPEGLSPSRIDDNDVSLRCADLGEIARRCVLIGTIVLACLAGRGRAQGDTSDLVGQLAAPGSVAHQCPDPAIALDAALAATSGS